MNSVRHSVARPGIITVVLAEQMFYHSEETEVPTLRPASIPNTMVTYRRYFCVSLISNVRTKRRAHSEFNMGLSWGADLLAGSSSLHVIHGAGGVKMFFFCFANVVTREKYMSEKTSVLVSHIDVDALHFFFEKYLMNSAISDAGKKCAVVKTAFLEKLARRPKLRDVIRQAADAILREKNHLQ